MLENSVLTWRYLVEEIMIDIQAILLGVMSCQFCAQSTKLSRPINCASGYESFGIKMHYIYRLRNMLLGIIHFAKCIFICAHTLVINP